MLLLPVSHEDSVMRRVPWVSLGIFALCTLVQAHSCAVTPGIERRAAVIEHEMMQLRQQVIDEYEASLYEPKNEDDEAQAEAEAKAEAEARRKADEHDKLIEDLAKGGSARDRMRVLDESMRDEQPKRFETGELTKPGDPRFERYKELETELQALVDEVPVMRLGYRPALDGLWRMLTSMFAHGGWLHLIGNMWFLYLVGCNLEDRWGRWQLATFYLVAGCIAALSFTALHRESTGPLVGASGAVAGAMGAFMVCFARTKVRMFYLYFLLLTPRWGTFQASAWVVLVLWMAEQFVMTLVEAASSHSQIAYSAHAGGFLFGAIVALLLRKSGVDSQLDEASGVAAEKGVTVWQEHPLYMRAVEQRDRNEDPAAIATLIELLAENPDHVGAHELLFELGLVHRDLRAVDFGLPFMIDHHQRLRLYEPLLELYRDLRRTFPEYGLTDQELLRVATAAGHSKEGALVIQAVSEMIEQHPQSALLPRALWLAAQTQARLGSEELQRDTLTRIVSRFPEHACAALAREQLGKLEATV